MASSSCSCFSVNFTAASFNPNKPLTSSPNQLLPTSRFSSFQSKLPLFSLHLSQNLSGTYFRKSKAAPGFLVRCSFALFFYFKCEMKSFGNFLKDVFFVPQQVVASGAKAEPLRVMISGAPASGKGTQCELITKKVTFFFFVINIFILFVYVIDCSFEILNSVTQLFSG